MNTLCLIFLHLIASPVVQAVGDRGSAVQKVIELLGECKAKVLKDLDAETAAMKEYTAFCDNEVKDKLYAIETAGRGIEEAKATIADSEATIATSEDEIATLGTHIAAKEKELAEAQKVRAEEHGNFVAAEKELVTSIDQLGRAVQVLKKGSFMQMRGGHMDKKSYQAIQAIGTIIESQWVGAGTRKTLSSFLQAAAQAKEAEDEDFSLDQPQAKQVAYESSSGGIIQTVEEMQGKAEDTLSELRKKEMTESQEFQLLEGGLKDEISHGKSKLSMNTKLKAESTQAAEEAQGELSETTKTKSADEAYVTTMKTECQSKAVEYEETMKSGKAEIAAIGKATTILEEGVTAFLEVSSRVRRSTTKWNPDDDDESDEIAAAREQIVGIFKGVAQKHHSYVFSQLASMAASDPFAKIKGLINDMIEKLLKEAQEEATHEAFCQEEMGKSKASQADKTMKLDKFSTRVDEASSKVSELTESIKTLEAEIAEIDKGQAEATALRTKEHEEFSVVSKDYKDSATAVAKAIEVLQSFYSGASLMQIKSTTKLQSQTKVHAEGNGDAANVIIGVLEVAQEDFTSLLAEAEAVESEAQSTFDKMTTENKIAKASKGAEAKAKASELKSVSNSLEMSKEDQAATSKELDAVNAYIDKLRPECESKVMSYEEKKAAREAEIQGLKDALEILAGKGVALAQTGHFLKRIQRV
jgi:chromosome segregation ATPase